MKNAPIIIVKKKKAHGHGHHGGAWKVAYADFVTAMMAFFLVLWIVGQSRAVKAGVAGYFRDPGVLETGRSTGILPGADAGVAENGPPKFDNKAGNGPSAAEQAALEQKARMLKAMLARTPEFKSLVDQVEISVTKEGLRIELIEQTDSLFFDTGSAALKPQTVRLLGAIAAELGSLENAVVIEGHSDSRRYSTSGIYTNWELSADRANAARRAMESSGLHPGQVREVRGYADTRLRYKADPLDPRNRRVSITVPNTGAARAEGHSSTAASPAQGQAPPPAATTAPAGEAPQPQPAAAAH